MIAALLRLALLLVLALVPGGAARAHAALTASDPPAGAVLDAAPGHVVLSFSEPVSPLVLDLVGPEGGPVALTASAGPGNALLVALPAGLRGAHALNWRVVSADGHPVGGALLFAVGAPGAAPVVEQPAPGLHALIWATRVALYLGLFLGIGALPFHAFIAPVPVGARRLSKGLMVLGLAAIPPALGLQGLDMLGKGLGGLADPAVWAAAIGSAYARTLALAALAFGLGLAAWAQGGRMLALLAWVGLGAALAASGHAGSAPPQGVMRATVFTHALMVAAWAGALLPFLLVVRAGGEAAQAMLRRFSVAILPVTALLLASGVMLARVQVGTPQALAGTDYGLVFAAKLVLLALLFALAALNRFRLTPALMRGQAGAKGRFARSVRAEIVLVLAILGTVGLWRFTPPPRALQAVATAPADPAGVHMEGATHAAHLLIDPGQVGQATATAFVMDAELEPFMPREVTLSLANARAGIDWVRVPLTATPDEAWEAGLLLPVSGTWQVRLDLLVTDFDSVRLEGEVEIAP